MELNEKEKEILFEIEDGLCTEKALAKRFQNIPLERIKLILKKLADLNLVEQGEYKDKDLERYLKLNGKKEKEEFKKENPPSFSLSKSGRKLLGLEKF